MDVCVCVCVCVSPSRTKSWLRHCLYPIFRLSVWIFSLWTGLIMILKIEPIIRSTGGPLLPFSAREIVTLGTNPNWSGFYYIMFFFIILLVTCANSFHHENGNNGLCVWALYVSIFGSPTISFIIDSRLIQFSSLWINVTVEIQNYLKKMYIPYII